MRPVGTIKVIYAVLGGVALFLLVMARIESPEEHQLIRVMDVAVGEVDRAEGTPYRRFCGIR